MVAGKLANLGEGNPTGKNQHKEGTAPNGAVSQTSAAAMLNVSRRNVQRAKFDTSALIK